MLSNIICSTCKNEFRQKFPTQKYCSHHCAQIARRTVERPSAEELEKMIQENPWEHVAKFYGVSSYTIRKWAKYYGINIIKPRPQWVICPCCKKTYKQKNQKQKYCSRSCASKHKGKTLV